MIICKTTCFSTLILLLFDSFMCIVELGMYLLKISVYMTLLSLMEISHLDHDMDLFVQTKQLFSWGWLMTCKTFCKLE